MTSLERLLKTKQAAELLGLSESTVKRLVNEGRLPAVRTQGGHRLIPESAARSYLLRRHEGTGVVAGCVSLENQPTSLNIVEELLYRALRAGRTIEARDILVRAADSGYDAERLADDLIRPVMTRIGHAWAVDELDVYEEHRATRIVELGLMELIRLRPAPAAGAPVAIGAAPEGDPYTIPGLLCELALRQLGWDVVNLGPNLPLCSLGKAVRAHQPRLVWLSVHWLTDREAFVEAYRSFFETASKSNAAIVLGGPALDSELRGRLVAASLGDRISHLCEFARRLVPATSGVADGSMDRSATNPT